MNEGDPRNKQEVFDKATASLKTNEAQELNAKIQAVDGGKSGNGNTLVNESFYRLSELDE